VQVRQFCTTTNVTIEKLAIILEMSNEDAMSFYKGTHNYDLRSIAKFESIMQEVVTKGIEALKNNYSKNSNYDKKRTE
jgi:hypothetical protein